MQTPEEQELVKYIEEIIKATNEGRIKWSKVNPTTYLWTRETPEKKAKIVLQRIDKRNIERAPTGRGIIRGLQRSYVLQVFESPGAGEALIDINTSERSEFKTLLTSLFDTISLNITRKGLDFLKGVLE